MMNLNPAVAIELCRRICWEPETIVVGRWIGGAWWRVYRKGVCYGNVCSEPEPTYRELIWLEKTVIKWL